MEFVSPRPTSVPGQSPVSAGQAFGDGFDHPALEESLRQVWEGGKADVGAQVALLAAAVAAAGAGELTEELRARAGTEAHKLAGSLGTLGFAWASECARELERALGGDPAASSQVAALAGAVTALQDGLFGDARVQLPGAAERVYAPEESLAVADHIDLLVVVERDREARLMVADAQARGLTVALAEDLTSAELALVERTPELVLLDLTLREGAARALEFLSEAAEGRSVVVIVDEHESVDRVEVARRRGRGFLPPRLSPGETIDVVLALRDRERMPGTRVLVVDDDPIILATVRAVLGQSGLTVMACHGSEGFWAALEEFIPDLIVLDFEMPGVSGLELCRAIRNDRRWEGLPVVFLTGRTDAESVHEVFDAGADDYVAKPLVGPELTARIANRLERVRLLRRLADTDALTGLPNRRKSTESMEVLLRMARRLRQPLSLCVMDVDNFKAINDGHGHAAGDAVLRGVGAAMRSSFRGEDAIARWGGDEFVVAMYGLTITDARDRVAAFLESIRGARFADGGSVAATMSAGLAAYGEDGDSLDDLYRAADKGLYAAKEEGRDRVVPISDRRQAAGPIDIFIVADGPAPAAPLEGHLRTRGYRTRQIVSTAQAALELERDPRPRAFLVILDLDAAGVNAGEVLSMIDHADPTAAPTVVLLGAGAGEVDGLVESSSAAVQRLAKPYRLCDLTQHVKRAAARGR